MIVNTEDYLIHNIDFVGNSDNTLNTNRINVVASIFYIIFLYAVYIGSFLVESIPIWYLGGFVLFSVVGFGISFGIYIKDRASESLKIALSVSYLILYLYIMILGHAEYRFTLIFPLLCFFILYHSPGFILTISVAAIAVNLLNVSVCVFVFDRVSIDFTSRYVFQLGAVALSTVGAYWASKAYCMSFEQTKTQNHQLQLMALQTIETIANTIDAKDPYTQGHSRRVADYSVHIAEHMGFDKDEQARIRYIALLHDVGKISVPDSVLNKPSHLTDEEFALMKDHTTAGGDILRDIELIPDIELGAKYHHERYDGKGYPEGLKGDEIPLIARIICLADAYDAMTSNRVYRKHLTADVIMEEIKRCKGNQFDPDCVDAFLEYLNEESIDSAIEKAFKIEDKSNATKSKKEGSHIIAKISEEESQRTKDNRNLDELTGVHNRVYGEKNLTDSLSNTTGALVLINIVGLKEINLEYGFRRGDYYLITVAKELMAVKEDHLTMRFTGNEFLCFFPQLTQREEISAVIDRFISNMDAIEENDPLIEERLGVSCAVTVHNNTSVSLINRLRELEKALYYLKRVGENEYCFYDPKKKNGDEYVRPEDIRDLIEMFVRKDSYTDTQIMGENDFLRMMNILKKSGQKNFALLLFTVKPVKGDNMPVENRQRAMAYLEDAIIKTVKDKNLLSSYSSLQRIVSLCSPQFNLSDESDSIETVKKDILTYFYRMYEDFDVEIICNYDIIR